ncbi:4Fe-4S dicluster domain-containing protein [Slackia exigua]|uniref:4Fe-4S dicluster domain-containing protein n=1 Tax=Slackia exigua TaxID=84109 RepID=UPI002551C5E7|nr:4Fe-4S dicluster domain-containing protein [Slackia exigua]MDK7724663.1 4Fe-4S dicluster domain-containing protein [Slackia exigua]MDK7726271.1 4Fe-4S dicluster domain-containing protein [Slackia exigua]
MKLGMAIDLDRCIGCRTCAAICKNHNSEPEGIWWNRVFTIGSNEHQVAYETASDGFQMDFMPLSCQQCENPSCVKVCPTGASYVNDDGVILIDYERCIGCRYCISACPYQVRQFNWQDPKPLKEMGEDGYIYGWPLDYRDSGRLVYTQNRPKGVVEKCTFCAQYVAKGENPVCVHGCPMNARIFGDMEDPDSDINQYLEGRSFTRLKEENGTSPKVFYIKSGAKEKPALYDRFHVDQKGAE